MTYYLKGALVEYGIGLGSYLPNVVMFQFNPEEITRTYEVPPRPSGASLREVNQAGEVPVEKISLNAHFSAQEDVARKNPMTRVAGIGPQLAALDKLVRPTGPISGLLNKAVDKIGSMISSSNNSDPAQQIPRESYPRVLFVWGATRVLPVTIDALTIVEKQYDNFLNPTLAEVSIAMTAIQPDPCSDDPIAKGLYAVSQYVRDALALSNVVSTGFQVDDIIKF
ncbi:MAG: hypothetical protein WKG01_35945 [Kofleriaceae bacterium]